MPDRENETQESWNLLTDLGISQIFHKKIDS